MEPQSESDPKTWITEAVQEGIKRRFVEDTTGAEQKAENLQPMDENPEYNNSPNEPTEEYIEEGFIRQVAFFQQCTGKEVNLEGVDKETKRFLSDAYYERQGWDETLDNVTRGQIQSLFPDNGGSRVHGPL